MRITTKEHQAIKDVIHQLDPRAKIYLFGSRIDDHSRGGDIDLLILSEVITDLDRRNLRVELFDRLGEQKIDLIIAKDLSRAFVRIAYNQGLLL